MNKIVLSIIKRVNRYKYYRILGVRFGSSCRFLGEVSFGTEPYLVKIGNHVSITNSTFITHDGAVWVFREKDPTIDIFGCIEVGDNVFIGYDCVLLPGVKIGSNVIVGARSLVVGELESGYVYAGSPAKKVRTIEEYLDKNESSIIHTKGLNRLEKKKVILSNIYNTLK